VTSSSANARRRHLNRKYKTIRKKITDIPNPHTPGALAVSDGTTCIGHIVHAGSYFAFDADDILIGEYATQREAMRAIPIKECLEEEVS
jgi:hypothetical protein